MKAARRTADREHRKLHVPLVNRNKSLDPTCDRPAPTNVVVMGPPGSGKTTVIRSLVKKYTRQNLRDVLGPCTVVSSKPVAVSPKSYLERTNYIMLTFSFFVFMQEPAPHLFRMP